MTPLKPDDTQPIPRRRCARCDTKLGRATYVFGKQAPLCEVCFDHLVRAAEARRKTEGQTFTEWLRSLVGWW